MVYTFYTSFIPISFANGIPISLRIYTCIPMAFIFNTDCIAILSLNWGYNFLNGLQLYTEFINRVYLFYTYVIPLQLLKLIACLRGLHIDMYYILIADGDRVAHRCTGCSGSSSVIRIVAHMLYQTCTPQFTSAGPGLATLFVPSAKSVVVRQVQALRIADPSSSSDQVGSN